MRKIGLCALAAMAMAGSTVADPLALTVRGYRFSGTFDPPIKKRNDSWIENRIDGHRLRARDRERMLAGAAAMTPDAVYQQGLGLYEDSEDPMNHPVGLRLLELAADRGHADAQKKLVDIYRSSNFDKAAYWQEKLAAAGTPGDWAEMAGRYDGRTDPVSRAHQAGWYGLAAEAGNLYAEKAMAARYEGQDDTAALAVNWYGQAAGQGDAGAMDRLAWLYMGRPKPGAQYGDGKLLDPHAAIAWYDRALKADAFQHAWTLCQWPAGDAAEVRADALARCRSDYDAGKVRDVENRLALGTALMKGDGLAQDYGAAWKILDGLKAPEADYDCALMLAEALGRPADPDAAQQRMARSAWQGYAPAVEWLTTRGLPVGPVRGELDLNEFTPGYRLTASYGDTAISADTPAGAYAAMAGQAGDEAYPARAADDEVEGVVTVRCRWGMQGQLSDCVADKVGPKGYGFEAATISMVSKLRFTSDPAEAWPSDTAERWTSFEVHWVLQ